MANLVWPKSYFERLPVDALKVGSPKETMQDEIVGIRGWLASLDMKNVTGRSFQAGTTSLDGRKNRRESASLLA